MYWNLVLYSLLCFGMFCLGSCSGTGERPENSVEAGVPPEIFPDYREVTIPPNIASLNFRLASADSVEACYALFSGKEGSSMEAFGKRSLQIDEKAWRKLLAENAGQTVQVSLATRVGSQWTVWDAFPLFVREEPIDSHLVYRLIEPGYEKWHIVGLYVRDLTTFEETPLIRNDMTGYNCINCHSFCQNDPEQMLFHMRAAHGGTYIVHQRQVEKLDTKTPQTLSHLTYPAWHPSGRYVVASVNDIRQIFHAVKEKKMEVFDTASDVVVYDVQKHAILSKASIQSEDAFETFPAFSPDGKWLYYCVAPARKMPEEYDQVRYSLCRVAFDAEKGEIRLPADTLVRADSLSYTFPRISPDGRFLFYTETAYGQFPIWHTDAELRMLDLTTLQPVDMSPLNSPDTESYHSWGSNGRYVVFSSRRDNGLYTLPYLCYIAEDGRPAKPFLLPQEDPEYYDFLLYSYNIPELVTGCPSVGPYEIQQVALNGETQRVTYR